MRRTHQVRRTGADSSLMSHSRQDSSAAIRRRAPPPFWQQPRKWIAGYLFAGPAIILIIIFSLISIIFSLYVSFFRVRRHLAEPAIPGPWQLPRGAFQGSPLLDCAQEHDLLRRSAWCPASPSPRFLLALAGHKVRGRGSVSHHLLPTFHHAHRGHGPDLGLAVQPRGDVQPDAERSSASRGPTG